MAIKSNTFNSSAITSAQYDTETQQLEVTFKSGQSYTLQGVPEEVYDQFVNAPSAGGFWHSVLKDNYT